MNGTERMAISVYEAAKALGVHHRTVRRYIELGILPSVKLGRRVLIPLEALRRLLDAQPRRRDSKE